jgi:hypothetical protein
VVDTSRTRSALQTLLASNVTGGISAQDLRDFLATAQLLNVPNEQTGATYTFVLADADRTTVFNRASAQAVTIPTNASVPFPVGTRLPCFRKGAGLPTIAGDVGVTLNKPTGIRPNRTMGAMVKKAADQTGANFTSSTALAWAGEIYDTDVFHDNASNNSRLTIPSGLGITKVRAGAKVRLANITADLWASLILGKTGTTAFDGQAAQAFETGLTTPEGGFSSGSFLVTAGTDYLQAFLIVETDTTVDVIADRSNFWLEVTEIDAVGTITYQNGYVMVEKIGTDEWNIGGPALG